MVPDVRESAKLGVSFSYCKWGVSFYTHLVHTLTNSTAPKLRLLPPSYPLQPLLGSDHRLHQLGRRLLLHRHSPPVPRGVRLDPRAVALPPGGDRVLRQRAADRRGNRPVQDEDHRPDGLQG